MSRKQAVRTRPGKKAEVERKRDERAARRALAKERRNRSGDGTDAEEFVSFANQLQVLGLRLREVPGDGNCLFRALADQLEGHSRNHLKHRQETVDYMVKHREDFEPFVEDDVPFDRHVTNLAQPGTFAGNDAIVAFARSNQVNVVIHQLNNPLWQWQGMDSVVAQCTVPFKCNFFLFIFSPHTDVSRCCCSYITATFFICALYSTGADPDFTAVGTDHPYAPASWDVNESESEQDDNYEHRSQEHRMLSKPENADLKKGENGLRKGGGEDLKSNIDGNNTNRVQQKISNKQIKAQQRQQKKKRQEERHRQKVLESRGNNTDNNRQEAEDTSSAVTVVKALTALNI
ncbi:OTU domain-containing protein 3 [Bombina bombina]|uniref:OTU domain-containing protein 3 n=1 Tax=Bombina bombina TaxID=8345 RepID=UPI00235B1DFA|nr:OTU domain-containing protein 3 [Bombina bombina]